MGMHKTRVIMLTTWDNYLFKRVDNSALVIFRMLYGILLASEAIGSIAMGAVRRLFIEPQFTFAFIGFEFLEPLPGNGMYVLYALMGLAGVFISIGFKYRYAMLFYAVAWTYVYLMQKSSYNNHCYLIMLLNYIMVFLPASRAVSIDVKRDKSYEQNYMYRYIYVFIITLLWIVYAYASIAKFYPDWMDGSFIKHLMATRGKDFELLQNPWVQAGILHFGLFFDMLIIPFLLWKRTRWLAVGSSVFFHIFNSIVFQIGVFPYLALSFLVFFFTTETLQKRFLRKKTFYNLSEVVVPKYKKLLVTSAGLFLLVMLLLPLRHWIIKDDVLWTEEGHKLSWRMMLRSRSGYAQFIIVDKNTKRRTNVNLTAYVADKQLNSLQTKPDFMWQFSQRLKRIQAAQGNDVAVYVNAQVSINGGPYYQFTDPTIDLAATSWNHFEHHEWILPSPLNKKDSRLKKL